MEVRERIWFVGVSQQQFSAMFCQSQRAALSNHTPKGGGRLSPMVLRVAQVQRAEDAVGGSRMI